MSRDVVLAYLHPNSIAASFHRSLLDLISYDNAGQQRLGQWANVKCGSTGIPEGRNQAVGVLMDDPALEWLLFIDADMGFAPDALERLMQVADPETRPVVGALCFAYREAEPDGMGGFACTPRPTIFDYIEHEDGLSRFTGRAHYPVNSLVACAGTGAAFLLIHRSVFDKIGDQPFDRLIGDDGRRLGEDISFCVRCGAHDIPIYVHTGVRTTHLKELWVSEGTFWSTMVAPPATIDTDIIVPIHERPHNAEPFMDSLRASTGRARVTAVAHKGDKATIRAWRQAGAEVVVQRPGRPSTFAAKVNDGIAATHRDLVFITGDDVRFHPGWLDHAQFVFHTQQAAVVGTNDTANPRVVAGEHATHMLIARQYIDEHGASFDGPGVCCHEGYGHWYVDDEIVTVARSRGVFAAALGSIVEHRHPIWGTAENDHVYELGQSKAEADSQLWRSRLAEHGSSPSGGDVPPTPEGDVHAPSSVAVG